MFTEYGLCLLGTGFGEHSTTLQNMLTSATTQVSLQIVMEFPGNCVVSSFNPDTVLWQMGSLCSVGRWTCALRELHNTFSVDVPLAAGHGRQKRIVRLRMSKNLK